MRLTPIRVLLAVAAVALATPAVTRAQDPNADLLREIEQLKQGQKQINQQLEEIRKLLAERPAPAAAAAPARPSVAGQVFALGANPVRGASTTRLTLVEFTDYQ
jgi:hypothetical protein